MLLSLIGMQPLIRAFILSRIILFTLNAGEIYCAMCVCLIGCIQGADCSGRTLATLLVAWVATLMVTSILLQWQYTWIVITTMTLMFLLVCACMAYNIKKTQVRTWFEDYQRTESERERRERRHIWTISGMEVEREVCQQFLLKQIIIFSNISSPHI